MREKETGEVVWVVAKEGRSEGIAATDDAGGDYGDEHATSDVADDSDGDHHADNVFWHDSLQLSAG